jgi:thiol-disulfide isomerase/thioredoxin
MMRFLPLACLALLPAFGAPADAPAETPPPRTRTALIAALRAAYDGKQDAAGETCMVLVDEASPTGSGIWIKRGRDIQLYGSSRLVPGDVAPELLCAGWLNTAGGPPTLKDKVVWIEFSATWCGPCKESMPRVRDLYRRFHEAGLEVVVVTDEPAKTFAPYLAQRGYAMPAAVGVGRDVIDGRFGVISWPTAILVGRDGRVAYVGDPRDDGLERVIAGLLKK